jgi:hypothetical protein
MLKTLKRNNAQNRQAISIDDAIEKKSIRVINLIGYGILILTFLDIVAIFIPPKFFDPNWELSSIGKTIEIVWAPLIAFVLIFYRRQQESIELGELKLLSLLSYLSLIIGIIYFMTVPLLITDTFRIARTNTSLVNRQLDAQRTQIEEITKQLNTANEEQLNNLFTINIQESPQLQGSSVKELKTSFLSQLNKKQEAAKTQLKQELSSKQRKLSKTAIKWILGAIVAGVSFLLIWQHTNWSSSIVASKKRQRKTLTIAD